ncbi:hypothetical protein V8B55DRAFT_1479948 [Mucor lusitanicus]|uniref:Uncharacterized protein n=2 Tax=Mucor circinelloides f. lusitanicus TaxID=29924 RepID=A0A162Q2R3_MUCCL|nr:hypothetical protein MUCCIDRAFT_115294 [Mucor lusitanicus CBS 277.49]
MRTHTLFAVALASFLIHFSDAATVAPVDGVLATVVPGGTGSLVGTAAGLVSPAPNPSSARKKKRSGLPLAGALPAGIVPGLSVAGLGAAAKDGKQSTGGLLKKRGLLDGVLGGGGGGGGGGSSRNDRSDDRHGDRYDDEITKRSSMQERDLLGGVLGGGGGGGGSKKAKPQGKAGSSRQNMKGTAKPASAKKGGLLGGLPVVGGLLKRDLLGSGLPVVGGLLGDGKTTSKSTVKQAAVTSGKGSRARKPSGGRGRGRARNQKKVQPAATKASGGGGLLGGGLPVVGGLLG